MKFSRSAGFHWSVSENDVKCGTTVLYVADTPFSPRMYWQAPAPHTPPLIVFAGDDGSVDALRERERLRARTAADDRGAGRAVADAAERGRGRHEPADEPSDRRLPMPELLSRSVVEVVYDALKREQVLRVDLIRELHADAARVAVQVIVRRRVARGSSCRGLRAVLEEVGVVRVPVHAQER